MTRKRIIKGTLWVLFALIGVCVIAITTHKDVPVSQTPAPYHLHHSSYKSHPTVCVSEWVHKVKGVETTTCREWTYK